MATFQHSTIVNPDSLAPSQDTQFFSMACGGQANFDFTVPETDSVVYSKSDDNSLVTATNAITIKQAGDYDLSAVGHFASSGARGTLEVLVNGDLKGRSIGDSGTADSPYFVVDITMNLSVGDVVTFVRSGVNLDQYSVRVAQRISNSIPQVDLSQYTIDSGIVDGDLITIDIAGKQLKKAVSGQTAIFIWDANGSSILPGAFANINLEGTATDQTFCQFDSGANTIRVVTGSRPVRLTALIDTAGTLGVDVQYYFVDGANAYASTLNGVQMSRVGTLGNADNDNYYHELIVAPNRDYTLTLRHSVSSQNQTIQAGSFIHAVEF